MPTPEPKAVDIHTNDLIRVCNQLDAHQPITDEYEARVHYANESHWHSQRDHIISWLSQYDTSGYYNRANPSTSGKRFYNSFKCASGLLWLAEGLGEDSAVLHHGVEAIDAAGTNYASQCGAFRKVVPWARIVGLAQPRLAHREPPRVWSIR